MAGRGTRELATAGIIAAVYAVATILLAPISYGAFQVRIAEALTVLPFLSRAAVPGLFAGCLIANFFGGMGWMDIVFGSLITLAAATLTRGVRHLKLRGREKYLAPLPPVVLNALGVSLYLAPIINADYWHVVGLIGVGELVACYALGLPLLLILQKRKELLF
jgi:uncharacterized membrane protein